MNTYFILKKISIIFQNIYVKDYLKLSAIIYHNNRKINLISLGFTFKDIQNFRFLFI